MSAGEAAAAPVPLRVVKGDPTAEELAALVAVVAARSKEPAAADKPSVRRAAWATAAERGLLSPLHPGPGAWRASAFPR